MRFTTRTFLWSFVPAALLLVTCFAAVQRLAGSLVRNRLQEGLKQSQVWVRMIHERDGVRNRRALEAVAGNAALKAGIDLLYAESGSQAARWTLEDQLSDICGTLDCNFLIVSDANGRPLAGVWRSGANLESLNLAQMRPPQQGFYAERGDVFHVTSAPVKRGAEQLGVLLLGERVEFGDFMTPVVLERDGKVVRSALKIGDAAAIESSLAACARRPECEINLAGETYLAMRTEGPHIGDGYALYNLQNVDAELAPVQATLRRVFAIVSMSALLATLALSVFSARSIVKPIDSLIAQLKQSEGIGKLREFDERSPIQEIRELNASYNRAASAIRESRDKLERASLAFIETLASALDARDPYTAGHSKRVSEYSCAIAKLLGLSPAMQEEIRVGALLHDIGKIGIPDEVLQKPGRLTVDEYRLIQMHPEIGRRILEGVDEFQRYLAVVELHHENWDGGGYPRGLRGEDVPLAARIVHVADAFDAMTSDRPYRNGMTAGQALRILDENAGTQFDPAMVAAFRSTVDPGDPNLAALRKSVFVAQASWPVLCGLPAISGSTGQEAYATKTVKILGLLLIAVASAVHAQEARSGFELRTTITGQAVHSGQLSDPPRAGSPVAAGVRAMLYPTWKLSSHWAVSGAVQIHSRPFFVEQLSTQGYGVKVDILQLHLSYAKFWKNKSIVLRAGHLSSAFGAFLLHYDDSDNALIDMPLAYGYYYKSVSTLGLAGAQADITLGKLDLRAQFANSSAANRRSLFDRDQYGNWSGGAGYTIRQGLRAGVSAHRGPYLHREHPYFRPDEAKPGELPATGYGIDAQWARGHLNMSAEWQRFLLAYRAVPAVFRTATYAEARYVLHPRWYVAARAGQTGNSRHQEQQAYEAVVGYRPSAHQLLKFGYQIRRGTGISRNRQNALMVQLVTTMRVASVARR